MAIVMLGSAVWIWSVEPIEHREPVSCALNEKTLQAFDSEGELIWQKSFPNAIGDLRQRLGRPVCHVLDADTDGRPEVYFQLWRENRLKQGGELVRMTDDGPLTLGILSVNGKLTYSLDVEHLLNPRVTNVVPGMEFRVAHDHVADEGLVDHRLGQRIPEVYYQVLVYETAPDGNALDVAMALGQRPSVD